jgi:hypothetical protein
MSEPTAKQGPTLCVGAHERGTSEARSKRGGEQS